MATLQTLAEVATEHNSTLMLPIPIDVLDAVRAHVHPPGSVDGHAVPATVEPRAASAG
jgi:hypothetical protein